MVATIIYQGTFPENIGMASKKEYLNTIKKEWKYGSISVKLNSEIIIDEKLATADKVYSVLKELWDQDLINLQEQFIALYLNRNNKIIGYRLISIGNMSACAVDVKLLVSIALHSMASGVIIAHNHSSGNLTASRQDENITEKIKQALALIDVVLFDHLIISSEGFLSFAEEGVLLTNIIFISICQTYSSFFIPVVQIRKFQK